MRKYDSYKDSGIEWIGEIPNHWDIARMKFHLDYQKGKNPKELKFSETEESEVYLAMDYLRGNPKQMLYVEDVENYVRVDDNEILLLWDGSNAGEFVLSKKGILSSTMAVLCLNNIQKDYSWYFFKHFEPQLKESTIGMGVPHVNGEELKNGLIALPTPEEQTAIAAYLDRKTAEIDELIADKKRLLELYEEEKTAIINQAVTKGINPDVPMKDSGIEWLGEIPEHWEVKRFDNLFAFSRGLPITKADLQESGIPCVSYGEIHSKYGFEVDPKRHLLKCVDEEYLKTNYKSLLQSGDFVFADTSEDLEGSGNFTYLNSSVPTFAGYHTIIGKPIIEFERRYLAYYFNTLSFRNQIRSKVTGTKVFSITQAILKFTNIIFPPIYEQQAIVNFIDKECTRINAKKAKTEKLIELLTEYRTALISEVVTGKIKVVD